MAIFMKIIVNFPPININWLISSLPTSIEPKKSQTIGLRQPRS